MKARFCAALLMLLGLAFHAQAASVPLVTGPQDPSQLNATTNALINSMNALMPGFGSLFVGKNYLDNGAMQIAQAGTGTITGGTTSGCPQTTYVADRWCVDTNVSSGAGQGAVITTSPSPPPGFQKSVKIWRNSGALLQPVCYIQEIETARSVQLQGKQVIFSAYVQPLAAFTATAPLSVTLISGTGTDEGLGTVTASPAVTPAWTGIASAAMTAGAASPSFTLGTTAVWNRIYSIPVAVPLTATELGVEICFTPVGTASGATDGFAITGAMLEQADTAQVTPSSFEYLPVGYDLARAQRYFYELDESATIFTAGACKAESTTVATCYVQFPVPMFKAPTMTYTNGFATETTVGGGTLGACTTLATASTVASTASSTTGVLVGCTAGTVPAAGSAGILYSNGGSGKIKAWAGF